MKTLKLNCYGITINHLEGDIGGASITSDLKEPEGQGSNLYNSAVDGIESLILAHFYAGIDVMSPVYIEGIETACQAMGNNIDDDDESKNTSITFTLKDEAQDSEHDITGTIDTKESLGVAMTFKGYSDCTSQNDIGTPVYVEKYQGELRVLIYADINRQDATHTISLSGAKNSKRLED
jgi:hypothetical protein